MTTTDNRQPKMIILKAENISKQYRLGLIGTGTISHDLNRWWHKIRGKEDPFLKIGDTNDRSTKGDSDYVWALKDINFEVRPGEVLGIIGKNGAGKSTLLKILSRVTTPTTGEIKTKGRIASLLEVGTGFHPELTGRENIYLNGAILGMTKAEIKAKEDEIIDFSGCARYVDTPVKRYSSGMRVRLAFAVAAFLEPDILVIDEVLAVGDAEFQKKAIGKMQDISKTDGRTVLFVSHNMAAVQNLCNRLIVLKNGSIKFSGEVKDGIDFYLNSSNIKNNDLELINENFRVNKISLLNESNNKTSVGILGKPLNFKIEFNSKIVVSNFVVKITVKNYFDKVLFVLSNFHTGQVFNIEKGENIIYCKIDKMPLFSGSYNVNLYFLDLIKRETILSGESVFNMVIEDGDFFNSGTIPNARNRGDFLVEHNWRM